MGPRAGRRTAIRLLDPVHRRADHRVPTLARRSHRLHLLRSPLIRPLQVGQSWRSRAVARLRPRYCVGVHRPASSTVMKPPRKSQRTSSLSSPAVFIECGGTRSSALGITTTAGFFLGCSSLPPDRQILGTGWIRLRWGGTVPLLGLSPPTFALVPITGTVQRITIVFDEAQDASGSPDQFGAAILDNIDVNGVLVGRGATDAN